MSVKEGNKKVKIRMDPFICYTLQLKFDKGSNFFPSCHFLRLNFKI